LALIASVGLIVMGAAAVVWGWQEVAAYGIAENYVAGLYIGAIVVGAGVIIAGLVGLLFLRK
jgi:hypothetical protein